MAQRTAARPRTQLRCTECGYAAPRWLGRCPDCGAWNSFAEEVCERSVSPVGFSGTTAVPLASLSASSAARHATGIGEFDRVLGGGLVDGSTVLLAGEPGIGKSTLLLQACARMAATRRTLMVSAEESCEQVRLRAERLGPVPEGLLVAAESDLDRILALVGQAQPDVLVIDSIQTIADGALESAAGSVSQVRECAARLVRAAKERRIATFLVGHVTKDGAIAGPRLLEHLVDVVLSFEGDRHHLLRLLRANKNRFGAAHEVGCFEMGEAGLAVVEDPSRLFLAERSATVSGVALTVALEGRRAFLAEVQALAVSSSLGVPRRQATGLDSGRLALLVAVLERRCRLPLGRADVFASSVGGVDICEPAADLALAMAVASSLEEVPVPDRTCVIGEVGLGGEVRPVPHLSVRLAEASRLGCRRALVSAVGLPRKAAIETIPVGTLEEALRMLRA
ncbi:MAG: DNA repair protein RadA [Actinomycetota bacterium]